MCLFLLVLKKKTEAKSVSRNLATKENWCGFTGRKCPPSRLTIALPLQIWFSYSPSVITQSHNCL